MRNIEKKNIYIYIYIYIVTEREKDREREDDKWTARKEGNKREITPKIQALAAGEHPS